MNARWSYTFLAACIWLPSVATAAPDIFEERFSDLPGQMRSMQGAVSYHPQQTNEQAAKIPQALGFGDALRTHSLSRATVTITNGSDLYLSEMTSLAIVRASGRPDSPGFYLRAGRARFIGRGGPASIPFRTPQVAGINRGTEFLVEVEDDRTVVTLFAGEAELTNANTPQGILVRQGEQGVAMPGRPIQIRPMIGTRSIVQWWLYYPGVIDPDELDFDAAERKELEQSLSSYRAGDLQSALRNYPGYPAPPDPVTELRRVYYATLLLAVGAVGRAEEQLRLVDTNSPLARALNATIKSVIPPPEDSGVHVPKTVQSRFQAGDQSPLTASELLAASYAEQSAHDLDAALVLARNAVAKSTNFAFGWARVAELEFGIGKTRAARQAVERAVTLAPRNAQAMAVRGFLLAAENRIHQAIEAFDTALALDSGLGNAWLGRGLCRRRLGWWATKREFLGNAADQSWLADLQTAAAVEPDRALLRSYAGKAFTEAGDAIAAKKEIAYASTLDPRDPTPRLYSALLFQEENRINESIRQLESSIDLNENRAVYRSKMLLDQDRAVRSANIASIYQDAGLPDVGVREAARAITSDYASFSSHLFLANSYDRLRDPRQVSLRYETAWLSEYLLANLLAPVGAGVLSPTISQHEYSKLFEQDRLRIASSTDYSSRGDWVQATTVFGQRGDSSFAIDGTYRFENGQRPNNDLDQTSLSLQLKHQLTANDSLYLQSIYYRADGGDLAQYHDSTNANSGVRFKEQQEPLLLAGYHHEWGPGSHTLFLGGRLHDTLDIRDPRQATAIVLKDTNNVALDALPITMVQDYRSRLTIYTAELQQVLQEGPNTLISGARYQTGDFRTRNQQDQPSLPGFVPPFSTNVQPNMNRLDLYVYEKWRPFESLQLIGGATYSRATFPENHRFGPVSGTEKTAEQVSPKAGVVWTPAKDTTLRAAYTRSLGGVSIDQSFRLEPSQMAGINQAYRSIMPESAGGPASLPRFETWGMELGQKLPTRTYLGVSGEILKSEATRSIGVFDRVGFPPAVQPSTTSERLDYQERSLRFSAGQLLGEEWALAMHYRISRAELDDRFSALPPVVTSGFVPKQNWEATLHQIQLTILYAHPSGFFGESQSQWYEQQNHGYTPTLNGDGFWQFNLFAGYRFPRRRAEIQLGILNLTDQNYRLNPLNLHSEMARERTVTARLSFVF